MSLSKGWALQLAVAVLVTVVFTSQVYVWVNLWPMTVSWWSALLWSLPQLFIWGLSIPLVARVVRRLPLEGPRRAMRFALHLGLSVAYAFLVLLILDASDAILRWSYLIGAPGSLVADIDKTIIYLHMGMAVYWVVLAADHARRYYGEAQARELQATRLEAQVAQSELTALRMQLQPHFLFNTLNSVTVLLRNDPGAAEQMVHRLSDFLRVTLEGDGSQEIPLEDELDFLRSYLAIEEIRFGERLTVTYDIDDGVRDALVPSLILQPLVENAVRYGVAPRSGPGTVGIRARRADEATELEVWDDGPGRTSGETGEGVGLSNTRRRLATLYGANQRVAVANRKEGGLRVSLSLPYHTEESPSL